MSLGANHSPVANNRRNRFMKRSRDARCKDNDAHTEFDRRKARCGCGAALLATCGRCGRDFGYSHLKRHERSCRDGGQATDDGRVIRFAYVQSDWKLAEGGGFSTPPKGQYWDGVPADYDGPALRVHTVDDPTMPGQEWMDSYDALFARVACDSSFELVRLFETWREFRSLVMGSSAQSAVHELKDVDILVAGNWIHELILDGGGNNMATASEWYQRLSKLELESDCRLFPPLDYCWYFGLKDVYYRHLARTPLSPLPFECIPTLFISSSQRSWKREAEAFAKQHGADTLVFKRSVSERKLHLHEDVSVRAVKRLVLSDRGSPEGLVWLAQPRVEQFSEHDEIRLYVVGGKLLWAVSSNFKDDSIALFAHGKGIEGCDYSERLSRAVEDLAKVVADRMQTHARHFLRVDVVKRRDGMWYINELEPFGNTFLHLEVISDAYERFPRLIEEIKLWMKQL